MVFIVLESGIGDFRENFNSELESIIKDQLDLKNTITEMKNTAGINRRLSNTEYNGSDT